MERDHKRTRNFLRLVVDKDARDTRISGVYLVTDQGERLPERVREAIAGGVSVVQFRHKGSDPGERLAIGSELRLVCRHAGVPFIVNDDLELARELDADGLHLGQEDGSPAEARRILGPQTIIGVSTHNLEEARLAEAAGADYIGFGAMYPTTSKEVQHRPGPAMLAAIRQEVRVPVVAIGGITRNNAAEVIDAGADAVAVISAILGSRDPGLAAAEVVQRDDVLVLEPGGRLRLAEQQVVELPGPPAGPDGLERHRASQGEVPRLEDHAEAAAPELALQLEPPHHRAGLEEPVEGPRQIAVRLALEVLEQRGEPLRGEGLLRGRGRLAVLRLSVRQSWQGRLPRAARRRRRHHRPFGAGSARRCRRGGRRSPRAPRGASAQICKAPAKVAPAVMPTKMPSFCASSLL